MAILLCERCHEMAFQHNADNTSDGSNLLSDLKQLNALMTHLRLRRSDLKRKINHRYSPIIRRLPHDVLSIVFSFCLPDYTKFHTSLSKFDLSAPLILGAVCKDWREAAWSSPRLWSAMAINISSSNLMFESQTSLAREWLARSGRLPLSIRIVSKRDSDDYNLFKLALVFSTVVNSQSFRWLTFHLAVPPQIYHIFHGPDFSAPILESLQIHSDKPPFHPFISGSRKFPLFQCPRLQEIRVTNVPVRWIKVPRDTVTRIYTDGRPLEDCRKLLHKSPSLVHCELMNIIPSAYPLNKRPLSTNLKHLTVQVGGADAWSVSRFLDDITAPCLETLRVESTEYVMQFDAAISGIEVHSLRSLLIRSACSLHTFTLVDAQFSLDSIMNLLGSMPTLKILTISAPRYRDETDETETMLQILARVIASQGQPTGRGFLPNLETLTFIGHQYLRPSKVPYIISTGPWTPHYGPRLPLSSVTLKIYSPVEYLIAEVIHFLLLKEYGITLKVCDTSGTVDDLLQATIDFYNSSSLGVDDEWVDGLDLGLADLEAIQYGE